MVPGSGGAGRCCCGAGRLPLAPGRPADGAVIHARPPLRPRLLPHLSRNARRRCLSSGDEGEELYSEPGGLPSPVGPQDAYPPPPDAYSAPPDAYSPGMPPLGGGPPPYRGRGPPRPSYLPQQAPGEPAASSGKPVSPREAVLEQALLLDKQGPCPAYLCLRK